MIHILRIVLPFAFGYFLSYMFRAVNAVLAPNLVADLGVDAAILGLLTSVYFVSFALFQLPLGVLLDRYGPRRVESSLLLIAAAGAYLFSIAESTSALIVGRAMIGLGVSACLMGAFKAYVMWFPKERLPLVNGIQMMAGSVGIVTAAQPVELALGYTDWRGIYLLLALATVVVSIVLFVTVPERRRDDDVETFADSIRALGKILRNPLFWSIAPAAAMSQASFMSLHTLWAGPWLRDVAGMERTQVATALTYMALALIPSYALVGWLSTRLTKYGVTTMQFCIVGMLLFTATQVVLIFEPKTYALPVWVMFNILATTAILAYAVLSRSFDERLSGRVITACNAFVFGSAFAFQYLAGVVINLYSVPGSQDFSPRGYGAAIGCMVALQLAAIFWYGLMTHRIRREHVKAL